MHRMQTILDKGDLFRQHGNVLIAYHGEDDKFWRVVVKSTQDGSGTYLQSFHRSKRRDLDAARRKWTLIKSTD